MFLDIAKCTLGGKITFSLESGSLISEDRKGEWPNSNREKFALPQLYCSVQALSWLDVASLPWISEGYIFLLSLFKCSSFPETSSHTCRNNVLPALWASLSPARLIHKINHHRVRDTMQYYPIRDWIWKQNPWVYFLNKVCNIYEYVCVYLHVVMASTYRDREHFIKKNK